MTDAVVAFDDALRSNESRRAGREEVRLQRPIGPLQSQIDSIESIAVRMNIAGLGGEMRLIDLEIQVQILVRQSRLQARGQAPRRRQGP